MLGQLGYRQSISHEQNIATHHQQQVRPTIQIGAPCQNIGLTHQVTQQQPIVQPLRIDQQQQAMPQY